MHLNVRTLRYGIHVVNVDTQHMRKVKMFPTHLKKKKVVIPADLS